MKKITIITILFIMILLPYMNSCTTKIYLDSLFSSNSSYGGFKDAVGYGEYAGNLAEDMDQYINENRISLNYKEFGSCVIGDINEDPTICYKEHDENGHITTPNANKEYLDVDWEEWNGKISDDYFKEIHVLGKYTTTNKEKVGEHTETHTSTEKVCKKWNYTSRSSTCAEWGEGTITTTEVVEDWDWVYHPEIKRGKCEENENQKCNIILDDKDVYPFQRPTFNLEDRYGIHVNEDDTTYSVSNYQVWNGNILYAYSKGTIEELDNKHIKLKLDANGIDLYALYEARDENESFETSFGLGDVVEATEEIGRGVGDSTAINFYLFNSNNEYINPYLFFDNSENAQISYVGLGTIIYGFENYTPDFSNRTNWTTGNRFYNEYCGQCTWFACGMFQQIYGFDSMLNGHGKYCASNAYNNLLKSKGWTLTQSPSPGAVFSKISGEFGHVGIVCGVTEDNSIVVVDGNYNSKNDTFEEFVALPDWSQRTIPYSAWYGKYEFCNPPQ